MWLGVPWSCRFCQTPSTGADSACQAKAMLLVHAGNKADLEAQRAVTAEEAQSYAAENELFFIETSAKTAANVNELFAEIARKLPKAESAKPPQGGIVLTQNTQPQPERKSSCC